MSATAQHPPPDEAAAPEGATDQSAFHKRLNRNRTACTCSICCGVDLLPPARLRRVSPLAEFVGRRLEVLGGAA